MSGLWPKGTLRVPHKTSNKLLDQTHDTTWPYRIITSTPWKHIGSWLQRHGGQRTQKRTQGIPLRGLGAKWTCEAGGSPWRGSAGNWLPLGSLKALTLAPPHAAVPDNIITAGTLWWCNPLGGPVRISRPIILSSELYFTFHFPGVDRCLRNQSFIDCHSKQSRGYQRGIQLNH